MKEHLLNLDALNINLGAGEMFVVNIILAFVMFGVALGIKPQTFKDVFSNPKSVILGIALQWVALPAVTFLVAILMNPLHVSGVDKALDPTRRDVEAAILELRRIGIRNLAITGGEPFLWESDGWHVSDVIKFARANGFLAITIYTNGTLPFDGCDADTVFVSPHGMEKTSVGHNITANRQCLHNIEVTQHPKRAPSQSRNLLS